MYRPCAIQGRLADCPMPQVRYRPMVCVVTYVSSPYQVELFNAIAKNDVVDLRVVYLKEKLNSHPWTHNNIAHRHLFLHTHSNRIKTAWQWCQESTVTVFNYYTHWFAIAALHFRHHSGKPWTFWGERPGFLGLGKFGKLGRKTLLHPLHTSQAPIWAVGEDGLKGYHCDWGDTRQYFNLPYYSDLKRFSNASRRTANGNRIILYVGVLTIRKGVLQMAEAFKEAATVDPKLRLHISGTGPLEQHVRKILRPVADKVTWLGFQPWDKLPQIYSGAEVLCLPTAYDGWAMVIPEALAAGLPVLTTRFAGAANEFIKDRENGWLLPSNESADITSALMMIGQLSNTTLHEMSVKARRSVAGHSLNHGASRFETATFEALAAFQCRFIASHEVSRNDTQKSLHKVRVLATDTYPNDELFSMQRYARLVQKAGSKLDIPVDLIPPPTILGRFSWGSRRLRKFAGYVDKYLLFPLVLRWRACSAPIDEKILIHITDQGLALAAPFVADFPLVITCHDLIAIRMATGDIRNQHADQRSWFQLCLLKALSTRSVLVSVSQKTMRDCQRIIKGFHHYKVIWNPIDLKLSEDTENYVYTSLPTSFLLHVGSDVWYKNRPGLLHIYGELLKIEPNAPDLLLIGNRVNSIEEKIIRDLRLDNRVCCIEKPNDYVLRKAYQSAEALIFPSLEEGFGWPVLEAMSLGCPVFTSDRAPLNEVGGDAVAYINPEHPEEAAQLIAKHLATSGWRSMMKKKGKCRSELFNEDSFIRGLASAYQLAGQMNSATK